MMKKLVIGLVAAGVAYAIWGVGSGMTKGRALAAPAVEEFHRRYNAGDLAGIRAAGSEGFRKAAPEKEFLDFLGAMQRKLGKATASTEASWKVNVFNMSVRVISEQNTTFEHGKGVETFVFEVEGDHALLLGYHVNSADLVLK